MRKLEERALALIREGKLPWDKEFANWDVANRKSFSPRERWIRAQLKELSASKRIHRSGKAERGWRLLGMLQAETGVESLAFEKIRPSVDDADRRFLQWFIWESLGFAEEISADRGSAVERSWYGRPLREQALRAQEALDLQCFERARLRLETAYLLRVMAQRDKSRRESRERLNQIGSMAPLAKMGKSSLEGGLKRGAITTKDARENYARYRALHSHYGLEHPRLSDKQLVRLVAEHFNVAPITIKRALKA